MAIIFEGRSFADKKEEKLVFRILELKKKGVVPHLVSIIVGEDEASHLYVNLKRKAVEGLGGDMTIVKLSSKSSVDKILESINWYNKDPEIHGIMVQMPLPKAINSYKSKIVNSIDPKKDVDGLRQDSVYVHPTAKAIFDILDFANGYLDLSKTLQVVVVGADGMVGKLTTLLLKDKGYSVIECDIDTPNLKEKTLQADVLVCATGSPKLITEDMIKKEAIVIDVGAPVGDCDLGVKSKASFVTPVPGGVGPVTISCLVENLVEACEK